MQLCASVLCVSQSEKSGTGEAVPEPCLDCIAIAHRVPITRKNVQYMIEIKIVNCAFLHCNLCDV